MLVPLLEEWGRGAGLYALSDQPLMVAALLSGL